MTMTVEAAITAMGEALTPAETAALITPEEITRIIAGYTAAAAHFEAALTAVRRAATAHGSHVEFERA